MQFSARPLRFRLRSLTRWKLTLFGRSLLLITAELLANAAIWIVAALLFARRRETRSTLSLALLAWTIGLRHGLDADHISAIDNATRGLISLGQLPVTCGLFFSLGHSTIVIAVNVAIAISTDIYDKFINVTDIGGIIGASVSGSFLFLIGLANSVILYRIIRARRQQQRAIAKGEIPSFEIGNKEKTITMRILGPVTKFVDRPWKMYPVGVLFGLGFDTASSIALLAVSALAKKGADGQRMAQSDIVVLPFLFTAGMTFVDSADSILMLYSYAGFPERSFRIFERSSSKEKMPRDIEGEAPDVESERVSRADVEAEPDSGVDDYFKSRDAAQMDIPDVDELPRNECGVEDVAVPPSTKLDDMDEDEMRHAQLLKQKTMSGLSIVLTLISIVVAFSISLLTIMGLIGENCSTCQAAADDPDGGGLAGRWWRFWAKANDQSGFIGAAIVGGFALVVAVWYGGKWMSGRMKRREGRDP